MKHQLLEKFLNFLNLSLNWTDEVNDIVQKLGTLLLNSLHGEKNRKDFTEEYKCTPDYWMSTDFDEFDEFYITGDYQLENI